MDFIEREHFSFASILSGAGVRRFFSELAT